MDDDLATLLQRLFNPHYYELMGQLAQMQHPNNVKSDTQGQTLEDIMNSQYRGYMQYSRNQANNFASDLQHPLSPDDLNDLLMKHIYTRGGMNIRSKIEPGM